MLHYLVSAERSNERGRLEGRSANRPKHVAGRPM
jgi:hypothetical protein